MGLHRDSLLCANLEDRHLKTWKLPVAGSCCNFLRMEGVASVVCIVQLPASRWVSSMQKFGANEPGRISSTECSFLCNAS